jgi:hypothetical protein
MMHYSYIDFGLGWSVNILGRASVHSEFFGGALDLLEDGISSFGGSFDLGFN